MTMTSRPSHRSRRLLLRLYGIGILTMVAVAATMIATRVFRDRSRRPLLTRTAFGVAGVVEYLPEGGGAATGGPPPLALVRYLNRLQAEAEIWLSLYTPQGALIGSNRQPPLPPPTADEVQRLQTNAIVTRAATTAVVVPLRRRGLLVAYGVAHPVPPPHRRELAVDVPIALAWIGLAAFLLSRTLGRPLQKIAAAARAFGSGNMAVRTGVSRRDEIGDVARAFDDMSEQIATLMKAQCELLASVSPNCVRPCREFGWRWISPKRVTPKRHAPPWAM